MSRCSGESVPIKPIELNRVLDGGISAENESRSSMRSLVLRGGAV